MIMTPVVWHLVDRHGREWIAAGQIGIVRSGDREIELSEAVDLGFKVTKMLVVAEAVQS